MRQVLKRYTGGIGTVRVSVAGRCFEAAFLPGGAVVGARGAGAGRGGDQGVS